jgi:hypothetical protein
MLCVVNVVITMVICVNIEVHNKIVHSHPILSHFLSIIIGRLYHNQARVEIILNITWVYSLEI